MKYFSYYPNNLIDCIKNYHSLFSYYCNNMEEIDSTTPISLEPKVIKDMVAKLKQEKAEFKTLAYKFDTLQTWQILALMDKYYDLSLDKLQEYQLGKYAKNFPIKKTIKTNMFDPIRAHKEFEYGYKKVKAIIWAKKDAKIVPFKVYSKEELCRLISENKIVVIDTETYGSIHTHLTENGFLTPEILALELNDKIFDIDTVTIIEGKNPEALAELIKDIDVNELKHDFEANYLPAYKKMLDFLVKCAKVTVENKEASKKNFQKRITQANEDIRETENVVKYITDTSKGR